MSNLNPPAHAPHTSNPPPSLPGPAPRWFLLTALIALIAYGIFLGCNATVAAGGSDSSGYLNSARMLTEGHLETVVRLPPELGDPEKLFRPNFQPLGFIATAEHARMVPSYPSGFPLHLAAAGKVLGWTFGPLLIGVAAALGSVVLCYLLGRELGLGAPAATVAAVTLGVCPFLFFVSVQPLSDTLATAWCLGAAFAALRARRRVGWAAACGAAYGVAILVRPTNIVLLPALVVFLGFRLRPLLFAVLGGLPIAAWLAFYNYTLYGGPLRSGYPSLETAFAASYVAPTAAHILKWLAAFIPVVLLPLPLVAVVRRDTRTRDVLGLALWFGAITTVYLFYAITHEDWSCLRFILPALPALLLMASIGLEGASRWLPSHWPACFRATAAIVLIAWALGGSWYWTRKLGILYLKGYEQAYAEANAAAKSLLPANALVVSSLLSGSIYFYNDFPILRWDQIGPADFNRYATLSMSAGRPVCALLHETEEPGALQEHCPGRWTKLGKVKSMTLWRLESLVAPAAVK